MKRFLAIFTDMRVLFCLGVVLTLVISALELFRGGAENYWVFRDACLDFWQDINVYTVEFVHAHDRYFIYSPIFCVLFTPFALLPYYLGGFAWNLFGYVVFYFAVRNLPGKLADKTAPIFLFLLLSVAQSLFCFQFNLLVAAIFLWAYILFEKDKPFWAILLIMVSATTKIYGAVELALLFCYPRFWRNMGYTLLAALMLILLPALNGGFEGAVRVYNNWLWMLSIHQMNAPVYYSIIYLPVIRLFAIPYSRLLQAAILLVLGVLFVLNYRRWQTPDFRIGVLAGLMGYIVLFSDAAEYTTYTIALSGYALWYFYNQPITNNNNPSPITRNPSPIIFWLIFIFFCVMPIDIFCPSFICQFVHTHLWLGVITFTVAWCTIIYTSIIKPLVF